MKICICQKKPYSVSALRLQTLASAAGVKCTLSEHVHKTLPTIEFSKHCLTYHKRPRDVRQHALLRVLQSLAYDLRELEYWANNQ